MSKKKSSRSETSGAIVFDSKTNTVMAQATQNNIKEKVQAVREVVPGKGTNEVILVLQYYDYNVEQAIQAYLEDGAKEALQEWSFTGSKQPNKKRKNKKKAQGEKPAVKSSDSVQQQAPTNGTEPATNGKVGLPNGHVAHENHHGIAESSQDSVSHVPGTTNVSREERASASSPSPPSSSSSSSVLLASQQSSVPVAAATSSQPQRQPQIRNKTTSDSNYQSRHSNNHRERTISEASTGSGILDGNHKKPHQGLEKAIKDLHRQTTSLERLRLLLDHEIERSIKSVKSVFEELRQGLSSREAQLLAEMDVLKKEASNMLEMRQAKATELKRQVDRSDRLQDKQVSELRAEIKHFVSERRHDEDLGRTTRFLYDSDHMLEEFKKFGEVVHVKSMYTARRASVSSIASSAVSHDGVHDDGAHSSEVHELQDRLRTSLKIQNSADREQPSSQSYSSSSESRPADYVGDNKPRDQRPRQSNPRSGTRRSTDPDSSTSGYGSPTSSAPSADSSQALNSSPRQGPPPYYRTSNTGSPGRGGARSGTSSSSGQYPRGRGRGRGGDNRGGRSSGKGGGGPPYENQRPASGTGYSTSRNVTPTVIGNPGA